MMNPGKANKWRFQCLQIFSLTEGGRGNCLCKSMNDIVGCKGKGRENVPATMYQHSSYEGGSDSENPGSNSWLCRLLAG